MTLDAADVRFVHLEGDMPDLPRLAVVGSRAATRAALSLVPGIVETARDMEVAFQAFQPSLNDTYRGTSPRNVMEGANFVSSAAEVPTHYPIAQHLEMSFLDRPPRQLFFGKHCQD